MERCSEHGTMAETLQEIRTSNACLGIELKHIAVQLQEQVVILERLSSKIGRLEEQIQETRAGTELRKSVLALIGTALTVGGGLVGTAITLLITNADKLRLLF